MNVNDLYFERIREGGKEFFDIKKGAKKFFKVKKRGARTSSWRKKGGQKVFYEWGVGLRLFLVVQNSQNPARVPRKFCTFPKYFFVYFLSLFEHFPTLILRCQLS